MYRGNIFNLKKHIQTTKDHSSAGISLTPSEQIFFKEIISNNQVHIVKTFRYVDDMLITYDDKKNRSTHATMERNIAKIETE